MDAGDHHLSGYLDITREPGMGEEASHRQGLIRNNGTPDR